MTTVHIIMVVSFLLLIVSFVMKEDVKLFGKSVERLLVILTMITMSICSFVIYLDVEPYVSIFSGVYLIVGLTNLILNENRPGDIIMWLTFFALIVFLITFLESSLYLINLFGG